MVLTRFGADGVRGVVCTPHLAASESSRAPVEEHRLLRAELQEVTPKQITLYGGFEIMLDTPGVLRRLPGLTLGSSRAVLVEWPRPGVRAVGFVTAEVERDGERLLVVYVPTMPNPTSGFALFFREADVCDSGMTVEEAVKFVVSGGVVVP